MQITEADAITTMTAAKRLDVSAERVRQLERAGILAQDQTWAPTPGNKVTFVRIWDRRRGLKACGVQPLGPRAGDV